jgi:uncharacterized protein (DUF2252 family)
VLVGADVKPRARTDGKAVAGERLRSRADRVRAGKHARASAPLSAHAEFEPAGSRDPIGLLLGQATDRVPELVPVRHGRMLASPFAYFRGAALPMAADLARTPVSGLSVQLCGDAHLANFGAFASPDRRLVFDINDFDETLPGPFEWDVKRLAASLSVASRQNGFNAARRRRIVQAMADQYRSAMRTFAGQRQFDVWYARLDVDQAITDMRAQLKTKQLKTVESMASSARTHTSMQALNKLTTTIDGQIRIIYRPPTTVPIEDLYTDVESEAVYEWVREVIAQYGRTLQPDRRHLLEQFTLVQAARKVVGVGSVGLRAWVILLDAMDGGDPLFLQAKEAPPSVLAAYVRRSEYRNQGERVVAGQHLMQAASDIMLGWTSNLGAYGVNRDFYVRQLRDWKFSLPIEQMRPYGLTRYGQMCGWTLARAHARSGDRVALAAYLGRSTKFDEAIVEFAEAYADCNEHDYDEFRRAVKDGRLDAVTDV